jgi:valyl-tRNA synthetase
MLYYLLDQTNLLLVPFAPHLAEYFHRELHPDADSIHLRIISNNQRIVTQKDTEERMDCLEEVIESVRKMRISLNLPMAYPLDHLIIYSETRNVMTFREVLLKELNIKTITWRSFSELEKRYKPVRSVVGKVYKARAGQVMKEIESGNVDDLQHECYTFDYVMNNREGYMDYKTDKTILYLTDHLKEENKREAELNLVRRQINVIRKQMELKMYDRVHIEIQRDEFWNGVDHQLWEMFQTQLGGDVVLVDKVNIPHQVGTTFLAVVKKV